MIEALPGKISIPSTFPFPPSLQCYFENPASIIDFFLLFQTPFFISNFIKFQLTPLQLGICSFVSQANITDSKLWVRTMLYTIFIRKTSLKLDLLNLNILGSSEYEKMAIFSKQLNFVLLTKNFLRLLTYNKYKNCL